MAAWQYFGRTTRLLRGAGTFDLHYRLWVWQRHCIAPVAARAMLAERVVALFAYDDLGLLPAPGSGAEWLRYVRQQWSAKRTAWLLVSGCGHRDAEVPLFLVHPYHNMGGWAPYIRDAEQCPPWSERVDAIVFRGSTTGPFEAAIDKLADLPRVRALELLRGSGLPADVGISSIVQTPDPVAARVRLGTLVRPPLPVSQMMGFRYQLMIDGNHGAWSAHVWKLLSGATCLWVRASSVNWYDDFFEPGVHYVPVRSDCGDLVQRYWAARADTQASRAMAEACAARAREVFDREKMIQVQAEAWAHTWREIIG